jgi:hypothetical protein
MQVLKYVCKYLSFQNKFGRVNNFIQHLLIMSHNNADSEYIMKSIKH